MVWGGYMETKTPKGIRENLISFITTTSRGARWGIFAILVSTSQLLLPLSISFWALSVSFNGGEIMPLTSISSWVFYIIAVISFAGWIGFTIFVFRLGINWRNDQSKDPLLEKLDSIEKSIESLTNEIRQERNERKKSSK